jgi:transcriptional regulator with XRE-family HTH domain
VARSARRQEQAALAAELRRRDRSLAEIASTLRDRYGVNARLAVRTARGWSQAEVAAEWTRRWPDDPKTFKSVSYWENWPGPTGHAPSLVVLDRLAQVYECDVAELLAGWGEHAEPGNPRNGAEPETLAWQVEHLDLPELTRATADWAARLPAAHRRALLLKLSTATSVAAGRTDTSPGGGQGPAAGELAGRWTSSYSYFSTGREQEFEGTHQIELRAAADRLMGRSDPSGTGSIELDLRAEGMLVTGSWTEHTDPDGYYGGAVYHGILQLVLDPTGRTMRGRWLGPDRDFVIDSGRWELTRRVTS